MRSFRAFLENACGITLNKSEDFARLIFEVIEGTRVSAQKAGHTWYAIPHWRRVATPRLWGTDTLIILVLDITINHWTED